MALVPPQSKEDWLYATIHLIATQQEAEMASLTQLAADVGRLSASVDDLAQKEGAQSAAIQALAGSVSALIDVVNELRAGLSDEEQAVVDEAMAQVGATIQKATTLLAGTGVQSTALNELRTNVEAATSPQAPPTP